MGFELTKRDLDRLKGVHPDLVKVVKRAAQTSPITFMVIEGVRTLEQQKKNVAAGASATLNSRHLVSENGYAHAVDLAPLKDKLIPWKDWPMFEKLSKEVKRAAKEVGVPIEWGGDWKTLKDGPHYQLPWKQYPSAAKAVKNEPKIDPRKETNLAESRTVKGAAAPAVVGVAMTADAAKTVTESLERAEPHISSGTWIGLAIGLILLVSAVVVLYSKWDDAGRPSMKEWFS